MPDVLEFKQKEAPSLQGEARCLNCKHEWEAVAPIGATWLVCPRCELCKGLFNAPVLPKLDQERWVCSCGCEVFYITRQETVCCQCGWPQSGF